MVNFNIPMHRMRLLLLCVVFSHGINAIHLWDNPDNITSTVPDSCKTALSQDISCHDKLITASDAASGAALVGSLADAYCTDECRESIEDFRKNVEVGCGNATYALFPNSTLEEAPLDLANGIAWAYKLSCIKDWYVWPRSGFVLADLNGSQRRFLPRGPLQRHQGSMLGLHAHVRIRPRKLRRWEGKAGTRRFLVASGFLRGGSGLLSVGIHVPGRSSRHATTVRKRPRQGMLRVLVHGHRRGYVRVYFPRRFGRHRQHDHPQLPRLPVS